MGLGVTETKQGPSYGGRRALVLGAGGFIGRWVSRGLHLAGAEVLSIVRPGGRHPALPGIQRSLDCLDTPALKGLLGTWAPELVFNLVGYGVCPGQQDAALSQAINISLPLSLADALAQGSNAPRRPVLIHIGSALEYGDVVGDLNPSGPAHPTTLYGRHKLEGVQRILPYFESGALGGGIARPFTVYGPEDNPHKLLPSLFRAAQGKAPISLSAGEQERDFIFIKDVVAGLLALGLHDEPRPPIVNLATGQLTPVREMIRITADALAMAPSLLNFGALPTRPEELSHDPVSLDALRGRIGPWTFTPLAEGIRQSISLMNHPGGPL